MTTERRVRRKPGENRASLIEAGITVFGTQGYHGASTGDVARVADVPQPHVYQHFRSKWELFEACLDTALDRLMSLGTSMGPAGASSQGETRHTDADALARLYIQAVTLIPHPSHGAAILTSLERVRNGITDAEWDRLVLGGVGSLWTSSQSGSRTPHQG